MLVIKFTLLIIIITEKPKSSNLRMKTRVPNPAKVPRARKRPRPKRGLKTRFPKPRPMPKPSTSKFCVTFAISATRSRVTPKRDVWSTSKFAERNKPKNLRVRNATLLQQQV